MRRLSPLTPLALLVLGIQGATWRGLPPELERHVPTIASFTCDNGKQRLDLARLNDNYCDCDDGSDEPGTSACAHTPALFHCPNQGFLSLDIPTSYVNDGVCDCCDGSDEYASGASCVAHCDAAMRQWQADKQERLAELTAGWDARARVVADAQTQWTDHEHLQHALERSVAALDARLAQLEATHREETQREQADKHEHVQAWKHHMATQLGLEELSTEQLVSILLEMGRKPLTAPHEMLPLIRHERAGSKSPMDVQDEAFRARQEAKEEEGKQSEAERDEADQDAEDDASSVTEPETHPLDRLYEELTARESYERTDAVHVRKQLNETKAEWTTHHEQLEAVTASLSKFYGPDRVFFALRDQCVEAKAGQYTYKVCWFGTAKQDHVQLGEMDDLDPEQDGHVLRFSGGDKCWNGPQRSLTVHLECGPEPMTLFEIEELSMCVYSAKLRTPAVCTEDDHERLFAVEKGKWGRHHIEMEVPPTL